jgi:proteic killer suppression protein
MDSDHYMVQQQLRCSLCCVMRNMLHFDMIKSFRHKGLLRLFETGTTSGIRPDHAKRLRLQLAALDTAQTIADMNIPGFRLHALKGELRGRWAISVSGNWRLTFEFREGNAYILDYEDYH